MKKPKSYGHDAGISEPDGFLIFIKSTFSQKEIPKLIKWLEKVQKYNEFNTKKKVKPTTTELLTATKISSKVK